MLKIVQGLIARSRNSSPLLCISQFFCYNSIYPKELGAIDIVMFSSYARNTNDAKDLTKFKDGVEPLKTPLSIKSPKIVEVKNILFVILLGFTQGFQQ